MQEQDRQVEEVVIVHIASSWKTHEEMHMMQLLSSGQSIWLPQKEIAAARKLGINESMVRDAGDGSVKN